MELNFSLWQGENLILTTLLINTQNLRFPTITKSHNYHPICLGSVTCQNQHHPICLGSVTCQNQHHPICLGSVTCQSHSNKGKSTWDSIQWQCHPVNTWQRLSFRKSDNWSPSPPRLSSGFGRPHFFLQSGRKRQMRNTVFHQTGLWVFLFSYAVLAHGGQSFSAKDQTVNF